MRKLPAQSPLNARLRRWAQSKRALPGGLNKNLRQRVKAMKGNSQSNVKAQQASEERTESDAEFRARADKRRRQLRKNSQGPIQRFLDRRFP